MYLKNNLTAEHAKTAEVISAAAQNKDIFSVLVYLAQPVDYMVFSARSAISAVKILFDRPKIILSLLGY
jgi:hypothetical protein